MVPKRAVRKENAVEEQIAVFWLCRLQIVDLGRKRMRRSVANQAFLTMTSQRLPMLRLKEHCSVIAL